MFEHLSTLCPCHALGHRSEEGPFRAGVRPGKGRLLRGNESWMRLLFIKEKGGLQCPQHTCQSVDGMLSSCRSGKTTGWELALYQTVLATFLAVGIVISCDGCCGAHISFPTTHPSILHCCEKHRWGSGLGELPLASGRCLPTQTWANARLTWGTKGQFPYLKAELTLM